MISDEQEMPADENEETPEQAATRKRKHRATYATDKRNGGYLIRVTGPYPEKFAGRDVPVTTKANAEHQERLTRLIWSGKDLETGLPVALYKFESKPRGDEEQVAF